MPDPILTSAVVKASAEAGKSTSKLLERLFGPLADEIGGEWAARHARRRQRNAQRVIEKAALKAPRTVGYASPRIAYKLLEEASNSDSEIMAEYLSGILAASCSPGGEDDRSVPWLNLVTSMSSLQLRAHFLLYREWVARLKPFGSLNLSDGNHASAAQMLFSQAEFVTVLAPESDRTPT